nr:DnaB [Erythrocladia irregularis]
MPHNTLAEKVILASIISNPHLLNRTINVLEPEVFFDETHQDIYNSIVTIYNTTPNINLLKIASVLTEKNTLQYIGGIHEIEDLGSNLINNDKFEEYIYLLLDKFFRRSIMIRSQKLLNMVRNDLIPLDTILNQFEEMFFDLNKHQHLPSSQFKITTLLNKFIHSIEQKNSNPKYQESISSGFNNLDQVTQGFQRSDLIIIASRPSMGKTALVLNIARNIAAQQSSPVIFFSLEMSSEQLLYRLLASESKVPLFKLRNQDIQKEDWEKLQNSIKTIAQFNIYIDDTPNITVQQLKSKIYQLLQLNKELSIIIIDYLQLISSKTTSTNRNQELASITRSLKIMCKEFNLPIIVLSQLSRNLESRTNKRPILSDLRESGCLSKNTFISTRSKQLKIYQLKNYYRRLVKSINENNIVTLSILKKIINNHNKIVYQILTVSGYFLEATGNHRIKTKKGWIKTAELTYEDEIAVKTKQLLNQTSLVEKCGANFNTIHWDKVKAIYLIGEKIVYDIEMTQTPNFIANNICVHNSIEQDADVVCMLYRDDYYNQDNTPTLRTDVAEISILKHRNGPTGIINLTFNPKFAEFIEK